MKVYLTRRRAVPVKSYAEASAKCRAFIDKHDLGAGCSSYDPAFVGGNIIDDTGNVIAHVSYNGRVWPGKDTDWKADLEPLYG